MCFSASASFTIAASTAVIGIATVKHVKYAKEILVAIVPLLFSFQQAIEGVLWLRLSESGNQAHDGNLVLIFLLLAQVLWPTYASVAVLLVEPKFLRRKILLVIAAAGLSLSIYLSMDFLSNPPIAAIRDHSIAYGRGVNPLSWEQLPYMICAILPLLVSSHRPIQTFGGLVLIGFFISAYFYFATFISVWCFFAAAGSALLYFYFSRGALSVAYSRI